MKRLFIAGLVSAFALGVCAADITYTWAGGTSTDWTDSKNYSPEGVPAANDILIIPTNVTLKLLSTDTDSWAVADRLKLIKPLADSSYLEVNVASGIASLRCAISFDGTDNATSRNKGGLVKIGEGLLQLMAERDNPYVHPYSTCITVNEGVLRCPTNLYTWNNCQLDRLHVAKGATFFPFRGVNSAAPNTCVRSLSGEGTITNDTRSIYGEPLILNAETTNTFNGLMSGGVRFYSAGYITIPVTDNVMTGSAFFVYNNNGRGTNGPYVSATKLGNMGEPSSLGTCAIMYESKSDGADSSGYLKYLGRNGETSNKTIGFKGETDYPSYLDGGEYGGLTLTGSIGTVWESQRHYTWVLTGENENECVIAGSINDSTSGKYGFSAITNIIKQGSGAWRFTDANRKWAGAITVEEGTLRYDSLASNGVRCALGMATNAFPYPITLKGGVFEYTGNTRLQVADRTIAVAGTGTLHNASGKGFHLDGIVSAAADSELVLAGETGGITNVVSGVTGDLSIRKTGDGVWRLTGEQSFTGGISVEDGVLLLDRPKYEYYRLWLRHTVSNDTGFMVYELGLYGQDGRRLNGGMTFDTSKKSALALEPGEACSDVTDRTYSHTGGDGGYFSNLFDDTTAALHGWQKRNGVTLRLDPEDESTWLPIVMRLSEESEPVDSYAVVVGPKPNWSGNGGHRSVDSYLLQGSVDGINWTKLNETNGYVQIGAEAQWFFSGKKYANGDAAQYTGGKTIASRPPSEDQPVMLGNAGFVSVASGAVIKALVDDISISKLRVSTGGAGTIDNVRLAAGGTIDVTGLTKSMTSVALPITFLNESETDIANLSGWTLTVDGEETSKWKKRVDPDGTIRITRNGTIFVVR